MAHHVIPRHINMARVQIRRELTERSHQAVGKYRLRCCDSDGAGDEPIIFPRDEVCSRVLDQTAANGEQCSAEDEKGPKSAPLGKAAKAVVEIIRRASDATKGGRNSVDDLKVLRQELEKQIRAIQSGVNDAHKDLHHKTVFNELLQSDLPPEEKSDPRVVLAGAFYFSITAYIILHARRPYHLHPRRLASLLFDFPRDRLRY
ncbi:hypothetical protein L249_1558 [Ophiocordyceps polyrhachis-furcata BCC 54312]|uniref:Uncharacterized protein n=1 Tax=Ophiocordyceps polyrhachis-furcata BCC 54312 TaxID=1330021 RepID=A0A367L4B4_9HYPO|nr:hypothetical protein L249_1558 [Ophiocordyceps polyrhachis-furcata BCC 54312]